MNRYLHAPGSLRAIAILVDLSVIYFIQFIGAYLGGFLATFAASFHSVEPMERVVAQGMFFGLVFWGAVAIFLNFIVLQGLSGSSFGKHLFHLQVVSSTGNAFGMREATFRTLLAPFSVLSMGIGLLMMLFTEKKQTFHDYVSKTYVIWVQPIVSQEGSQRTPKTAQILAFPAGAPKSEKVDHISNRKYG